MAHMLGVDTGGTFTDLFYFDGERVRVHKVLSTPHAPEQAILQGMREMGLSLQDLQLVHGSTVATNAVLEHKGVKTVYIGNRGLKDVLTIGRQSRRALYHLQPEPVPEPVPPQLCLETGGRLAADGSVVEPLTEEDVARLLQQIQEIKPRAVAINLLFSFLDDRFEKQIEQALPPELFVSRSSYVLPEYKEYERGIATWLNAWVGPLVDGYIRNLQKAVQPAHVAIMQSSGGTLDADQAGRLAVHLLLSGPAGGLAAAKAIADRLGETALLTFDMGGTSTDVALIDGEIQLTGSGKISHYPVAVPMIDMHTVGAGGGSIAFVDEGGMLQVGPRSAGASPGPACYDQGGTLATVTDANVVLGRIPPDTRLAGSLAIHADAARKAVQAVATDLNLTLEQAAEGIIDIAVEKMAQAIRVISVQRGYDSRRFTLLSFGGAGGLHVCAVADALNMTRALIPNHGGVLSAFGMLVAPRQRQLSRTCKTLLSETNEEALAGLFQSLREQGEQALRREGVDRVAVGYQVDLRYQGQTHCLTVPWRGIEASQAAFHELHVRQYGHRLNAAVELVNVRVAVTGPAARIDWQAQNSPAMDEEPAGTRLPGHDAPVPVWRRSQLQAGRVIPGPALVLDTQASSYIAPGWNCEKDQDGHLKLIKGR